ncbi:Sterol uptake control protein 2 [Cytospora mali]|uniref:Sterol uptake control protein 2 n=1 Tax=Cytospora mali TaxID=578113 RepID=A0A194UWC3_CYTMA|nr:Sterol uptake control protein 2 [Valsa mali var. pyri (nom. inval.)]
MGPAKTPSRSKPATANQRKRKAHVKSRAGCGNCKIRRVKCDEAKPRCNQCTNFGVVCNYGPTASSSAGELVLSFHGASYMEAPPKSPVSMNQIMLDLINHSLRHSPTGIMLGSQVYQLKIQDLEVLDRFSNGTVLTFGSNISKWVIQAETPRLACLFNYKLQSGDATSSERDAIWIASTFIGALQMCNIQAHSPEGAWPLQVSDPEEPDWLTLTLGKTDIWAFCDPSRTDSCFQELWIKCNVDGEDLEFSPYELKNGGFPNLPREMLDYLNLNDASTWALSPYFQAANIMSQLMPIEYNQVNIMKYTTFIHLIQPEFRKLWQWWTWKRAVLECQAICIYLERFHSNIPYLERLLRFPKQSCGLVTTR